MKRKLWYIFVDYLPLMLAALAAAALIVKFAVSFVQVILLGQ